MSVSGTYYSNVNRDLLDLIPGGAARILEIGCAAGLLGANYKEMNPGCVYMGVELNAAVAEQARARLDEVFVGNVENMDIDGLPIPENSLDCLVYGDVLEHLLSPWQELATRIKLVKDQGLVVACIPNIQHWSIIYGLLRGAWDYQDEGLLDRTHLRFFTLRSVVGLFQQAKLEILQIKGVRVHNDFSERLFQMLTPVLGQLDLDSKRFSDQATVLQYLVQARRSV